MLPLLRKCTIVRLSTTQVAAAAVAAAVVAAAAVDDEDEDGVQWWRRGGAFNGGSSKVQIGNDKATMEIDMSSGRRLWRASAFDSGNG